MKRCSVVILASKKCNTLNISGLEFLDFPGILRQNDKTPRLFLTWNAICQIWWLLLDTRTTGNYVMSQDDKFSLQFENQVILWMKIVTWYTFPNFLHEIPWHFPDVCPFSKFPWHFFKFPDNSLTLKKSFFPLLFPDLWQPWKCACQFFCGRLGVWNRTAPDRRHLLPVATTKLIMRCVYKLNFRCTLSFSMKMTSSTQLWYILQQVAMFFDGIACLMKIGPLFKREFSRVLMTWRSARARANFKCDVADVNI